MSEKSPFKCIGISGKLFGHRFKLIQGEYSTATDHCTRCGMPYGGWAFTK